MLLRVCWLNLEPWLTSELQLTADLQLILHIPFGGRLLGVEPEWAKVAGAGVEGEVSMADAYVGTVDVAAIERVASLWTGIPLEQLCNDEVSRLQVRANPL